jgi:hypothetical protein
MNREKPLPCRALIPYREVAETFNGTLTISITPCRALIPHREVGG